MQLVLGKKILQALLDRNEEINKEEIYSSPLTRRVVQVNQNPNGARKKSSPHTYQHGEAGYQETYRLPITTIQESLESGT